MCLTCPKLYTQKKCVKIFIKVTEEGIILKNISFCCSDKTHQSLCH